MKSRSLFASYLVFWNLLVSVAFIPATPARAALLPATTFYVDGSAGNDTNGGCFTIGATGTNFVLNAGAYNFTNLASTSGTTNPSIVTSASHNFVAADVGNCLHVTAGTSWLPGFYRIVSVATNAATLDRAVASSASVTNGTFFVGGALQTIVATVAISSRVASQQIFVKASATYTITQDIVLSTAVSPTTTAPPNQLVGYTTTPGDGGKASITLSTNTGLTAINGSGIIGWYIRNFIINCSTLGTSTGITVDDNSMIQNVKVSNCTTANITTVNNVSGVTVMDSELTGCTSACTATINANARTQILRNWIHDNASPGIKGGTPTTAFNLFSNNTGASSDCVGAIGTGQLILNNTFYKCGRDGIRGLGTSLGLSNHIRNNLFVSNVGAGITGASAPGWAAYPQYDGNAYFGNASTRVNMDDTGTVNAGNAAAPYTNVFDVILTADPFTNAAGGDFTLNNTAGGGKAARGTGTPGAISAATGTGKIDFGAFQAATAAAGSKGAYAQ